MFKRYLIASSSAQNQNNGFVLWPIVVGSLVIIVGAVGVLARSSGGQFGALFSVEAREAKDAAESGIEEVIASMNLPQNRGTLVASLDPSKWWNGAAPVNPCAPASSASNPLPGIKKYFQNDGTLTNVVAGSSSAALDSKHFYIYKISIKSSAGTSTYTRNAGTIPSSPTTSGSWTSSSSSPVEHADSIDLLNATNTGLISVSAVGYSRRPNGSYAKSLVTKEFEIVPKCCGRSFGDTYPVVSGVTTVTPAHGFDSRDCRSGGQGIGELGFIVGVNGNGRIDKGNSGSMSFYESNSSGTLVPTDQILSLNNNLDCSLAANISQCQINNQAANGNTLVTNYPIKLDPLPPPPVTTAKGCFGGNANLDTRNGSSMEGLSRSSVNFCAGSEVPALTGYTDSRGTNNQGKCAAQTIKGTEILPGSFGFIVGQSGADISAPLSNRCYTSMTRGSAQQDYCIDNLVLGTIDCSIGYIAPGPNTINIDTTDKKVRLFLYDTGYSGPGNIDGGDIKLGANGTITHTYSGSPAGLNQSDRLVIYGNLADQEFSFGGNSTSLAAQIFLPYGELEVSGNTVLNGILWVNDISVSGNLTINTPPASTICRALAGCSPANPNLAPILWDWVARSPNATSLFN